MPLKGRAAQKRTEAVQSRRLFRLLPRREKEKKEREDSDDTRNLHHHYIVPPLD
jgi:hypothetical protein